MKSFIIFLLSSFLFFNYSNGQYLCHDYYTIDFDSATNCWVNLIVNYSTDSNNIWQIGTPQKLVLDSALSGERVIITDSLNYYFINDTSSFIVFNTVGQGYTFPHTVIIGGWYWVNTDSLNDYGTISFSIDNGINWIDLLADSFFNANSIWEHKPILTGNSHSWQYFNTKMGFGYFANLYAQSVGDTLIFGDTLLFKFSFISDSIPDSLDGLMFDDLHFEDWSEGIEERKFNVFQSKVYPNPSNHKLRIEFENLETATFQILVFDNFGKVIIDDRLRENFYEINSMNFDSGIYHYKLINYKSEKKSTGKFIISH